MKAAALLVAIVAAMQAPSETDRVIARLDEYLAAYEPRLSELIADERMHQEIRGTVPSQPGDTSLRPSRFRRWRQLESEVAFIALPDDAGWVGIRHVKSVNFRPVSLIDASLVTLLTAPGLDAARELLRASAEHNLGLPRTTNLPNLPLEFLHARNRKRLSPRGDGSETVRGVRAMRLVFLERMSPTLIINPATGGDMPSVIRAWVDPRDGRLLRAEVNTFSSFAAKQFENQLRVEFVHNRALGLLVPADMRERFAVERPASGTSEATYTNFRRFQTSARIVPQ